MPVKLHSINSDIVDGENNPVFLDHIYAIKHHELVDAIGEIKRLHGPQVYLLPLSGVSGGGGVFQMRKPPVGVVIGIQFQPTSAPLIARRSAVDINQIALDEIVIDEEHSRVYAGSAITLEQLNQALGAELGRQFKVLGADLTSYTYAQVGATFMTGGMGPQRRYFSDSVNEISLHDGLQLRSIAGDSLRDYAGTYGWTGMVSAVCCDYYELPIEEIAFAIPINNTATDLSRLLQHFSPFAYLAIENGRVLSTDGGSDLIFGLEHITIDAMQPFIQSGENELTSRARQLQKNCEAAGADGLIFVNGYSNLAVDEFLLKLVDDIEKEDFTIAGIQLDHTEIFNSPDQMRAVREGVPFAARTRAPKGLYIYKGHTDANIRLNYACVSDSMQQLWTANERYVALVQNYIDSVPALTGHILVYGHLNPVGVDPHNRITLACDDKTIFNQAVAELEALRDEFTRDLQSLCETTGSVFVGGEKSAGSEAEIYPAFDGGCNTPAALLDKFKHQAETIRAASAMFNWRALKPYI